ncbi:MAG: class I SAM-dependent methyltransferase [Pseudomonadales bacterium]|nr:class I SAM-dependent methyltransferase [Pseudomonadales bacterium]
MDFYTNNAQALIAQYQSLDPEQVHSAWLKNLPKTPASQENNHALDIGAGAGRDALWLAEKGWQVTAIEPNNTLRQAIPQHKNIQTVDDQLPVLTNLPNQKYPLIIVSAVWMHLNQQQQQQALKRLKNLLTAKGLLIITWRNQANEQARKFELVNESLFQAFQAEYSIEIQQTDDKGGREDVVWKCAVIRPKAGNTP